jgi:hypothetical protein
MAVYYSAVCRFRFSINDRIAFDRVKFRPSAYRIRSSHKSAERRNVRRQSFFMILSPNESPAIYVRMSAKTDSFVNYFRDRLGTSSLKIEEPFTRIHPKPGASVTDPIGGSRLWRSPLPCWPNSGCVTAHDIGVKAAANGAAMCGGPGLSETER